MNKRCSFVFSHFKNFFNSLSQYVPGLVVKLGIMVGTFASTAFAASGNSRPNILLILADDLGYSDLGCYGGEIHTPNLDALAADGLRFTQFYNAARCCPSRACLLTGLYPHEAGLGDMTADAGAQFPGYRGSIGNQCVTIAEVLRQAGYQTLMSGKWHVGDMEPPTTRGFDEFFGYYVGYAVDSWNPSMMIRLPEGHPQRHYEAGKYYATDAITDNALDFITQARQTPDKPWFLYLAYQSPHFPLQASADEVAKYLPVYCAGWDKIREQRLARMKQLGIMPQQMALTLRSPIPRPAYALRDGLKTEDGANPAWTSLGSDRQVDLTHRMALYAAMVDHMDGCIGRVLADLKAHGQLDNTLIFFLSDNGACAEWAPYGFDFTLPEPVKPGFGINMDTEKYSSVLHAKDALGSMGGPGSYLTYGSGWANACNTPFRYYKHYDQEGGISTPLIVHWPNGFKDKGVWRTQVGHVIDLMATCVEAGRASYPKEFNKQPIHPMEGTSLLPAFDNKPLQREALYWAHDGNRAVRVGKWKLVALTNGKWELYNMELDRAEQHDLASENDELVKKLSAKWDAWAERCHVVPDPNRGYKTEGID